MKTDGAQQEGTPHDRPLRRDDLVLEELDGEAVLYDPRGGAVHRFNTISLLVWDACDGSQSAADIAREVTARYAVDAEEALGHVQRVVAELCTRDLLANGCATAANTDAAYEQSTTTPAAMDLSGATEATGRSKDLSGPVRRNPPPRGLPSRRAVLRGGARKLAFAAPVISTFFAQRAYASNPINPNLSAFGAGGCKNVGYSCNVPPDCCGTGLDLTTCQGNVCCVKTNKTGCYRDEDCCDYPTDTCNAGTCN